jgi:hypothetical protein
MPLRVSTGRTITPSLALLPSKLLNVPYIRQERSQWCWAACTQMVGSYHGNSGIRQCQLANWYFQQRHCCTTPNSSLCDRPCPADGIPKVYDHVGLNCTGAWGVLAFIAIQIEIDAGRPIEPGILWHLGGGHVVLVRGYQGTNHVYVHDPIKGHGWLTYQQLVNAYGLGYWFYTYTNLTKK